MDFLNWITGNWEAASTITGAVVGAIGLGWRKILLPRWRLARKQYYDALATLERVDKRLVEVEKQILPNGGGSVTDALRRIEVKSDYQHAISLALSNIQEIAFWMSDQTGLCIYASDELKRVVGNNALGNEWLSGLHPDDVEDVRRAWSQSVRDRRRFREHYRFAHQDGRIICVEGFGQTLEHFETGNIGFVGYLKELPEQEWTSKRLARSARRRRDSNE